MAASKLAETWSQTENCIDDGGFLPRLARSRKIDYGEMVETRAVFRFAQFRKRRDVARWACNKQVKSHFPFVGKFYQIYARERIHLC